MLGIINASMDLSGLTGVEVEQEPVRWDRRLTDWFLWVEGRMGSGALALGDGY